MEEIEVLMDNDDRGEVRLMESMEALGEGVRLSERRRRGSVNTCGGEVARFDNLMVGDEHGDIVLGDCTGVEGLEGFWPKRPKMPVSR